MKMGIKIIQIIKKSMLNKALVYLLISSSDLVSIFSCLDQKEHNTSKFYSGISALDRL
jgi:hypothetical protein